MFLLNQIDMIHQSSEDLLAEKERELLNDFGSSDSAHFSEEDR